MMKNVADWNNLELSIYLFFPFQLNTKRSKMRTEWKLKRKMTNSNYQEKKELTLVNNASKLSQGNYQKKMFVIEEIPRGWCPKFAPGLNIKIGIVQKVYVWSSCPSAKKIPPLENRFGKRTVWSLIYFLNYVYFDI